MNKKSEKFFKEYLSSLPDTNIKQFYDEVEWTPFPVLVMREFQKRFDPKNDKEFITKLVKTAEDARNKGQKISHIAKVKGLGISKQVKKDAKKKIAKNITSAKRMLTSSEENIELIKKLGELKKAGLITNQEFLQKKKQLLDKI